MSQDKTYNEASSADYKPQGADSRTSWVEMFPAAPKPKTALGTYRLLSPSASIRVSPLALGAMSLGDQWTGYMGGKGLGQAESEKLLDAFYEAGGNFIDTANNYQDEQSEHIIGEWMEKRGIRDEIVLATKYTTYYMDRAAGVHPGININYQGNGAKSMRLSVERSLKKLRTTYIDLLYVHWWDHSTSIPELMQALNDLVRSGKVLYLGVSDTPAWIVSQANEYARAHGMAQFVIYQGLWNLSVRDMERDVIPMCRNNNMSIAPWGVLGQGKFYPPEELKKRASVRGGTQPTEKQVKVVEALQEVAKEIGGDVQLAHVALAWCRQNMTDCWPIIGGTSVEQLQTNIKALEVTLTPEQLKKLDEASPFDHGFPTAIFGMDPRALPDHMPNSGLVQTVGYIKFNGYPQA
ncbi:putative aryl-alcohol dehydrogenase [Kockovaella imperatae]|uniref:Putative aryl-alcohol dehydrogenase n=1 Tax=Kockovaella imperatae TaxID=4999 RepID=A0A1Y1UKJ4_9TREE|nr:putative aryl-alcohol dehydrogenase [Kockovaella imperatae]ORX38519.1 putative aryl-alcohol dehydrogenase [Kockovaella imperatae]